VSFLAVGAVVWLVYRSLRERRETNRYGRIES
jgi:hypothetical protein